MTTDTHTHKRIIRHHRSGTWIAELIGPGQVPNTIHIRGRRLWSWSGGRLDNTQLATRGPMDGDRLGSIVDNDLPWEGDCRCDMIHVTDEIFTAWMTAPEWDG